VLEEVVEECGDVGLTVEKALEGAGAGDDQQVSGGKGSEHGEQPEAVGNAAWCRCAGAHGGCQASRAVLFLYMLLLACLMSWPALLPCSVHGARPDFGCGTLNAWGMLRGIGCRTFLPDLVGVSRETFEPFADDTGYWCLRASPDDARGFAYAALRRYPDASTTLAECSSRSMTS
jgi:hypothetical protein